MKVFSNILIIAFIGLFSSTYLFNLSPINYKGTIEIETPVEKSTLSLATDEEELLNPETITINHMSLNEEIIKSVSNSIFTVTVYDGNTLVRENIDNLELVSPTNEMTISINSDNPMITTLDISQKKMNLEDGTYDFVFSSNLISDEDKSSISVKITYDNGGNYYPALNVPETGTKGLTIYFATENGDTLIPVTRFVVEDKSITRMAIEQLQNGPVNSGFITLIGDVNNTTYNNGNVVIDLPGSYEGYDNGSTGGILAYEAFKKSIFEVDRYWPIYSLSFTVDRNKVDNYFHGIDLTNSLPNNEDNYLLYMAYKINDRYYLFDYKIDTAQAGITSNDTVEMKAQKLFDAYADSNIPYGISPVPKNVVLQKAALNENNLTLDFSESILNAYSDKNDLRHMMIESFVYTFTTIPDVDSINITVNGQSLNNYVEGMDSTGILYPPEFINPEVIQETND